MEAIQATAEEAEEEPTLKLDGTFGTECLMKCLATSLTVHRMALYEQQKLRARFQNGTYQASDGSKPEPSLKAMFQFRTRQSCFWVLNGFQNVPPIYPWLLVCADACEIELSHNRSAHRERAL